MKIVLATPLYPPDIAEQAHYAKELARRLAKNGHVITVVAFTHIPEKVDGVRIIAVNKRLPRAFRFVAFVNTLVTTARTADIIYAENGPSVEIPIVLLSFFVRTPFIFHIGDKEAHERATKNMFLRYFERAICKRARAVITDVPKTRPEVLPFQPTPVAEHAAYDASWGEHIASLLKVFSHV